MPDQWTTLPTMQLSPRENSVTSPYVTVSHICIIHAQCLVCLVRTDVAQLLCCVSSADSGVCEPTNQSRLSIKEEGAKTECFQQRGVTVLQSWTV